MFEPDGKIGRHSAWFLSTALAAQRAYAARSDRLNGRRASGSARVYDPLLTQLEDLARQIDGGLRRLHAADPSERVAILEDFGALVGRFDRLLAQSIANEGPDAVRVLSPFHTALMAEVIGGIVDLVGAR